MENKLMVARSYQSAERIGEPFEKNGKLYTKIKRECPRCSGQGIIVARVENGQPIPIPVAGGICFECQGNRYIYDEVRLYTEKEYNQMEAANQRAKEKKMAEQEKRMKEEFAENKRKWLVENGWSEDGVTYVVTGDSYSIKDELKAAGFRYDGTLRWHKATKDEKYAERLLEVHLDEVCSLSAWGKGTYNIGAKDIIDKKLAGTQPKSTSRWIGEVGEKIKDLKVQLIKKYSFDGHYGLTTLYSFQTEDGNILNWFSSTIQNVEVGDYTTIKYATVKKHDTYNNSQQTVITRAKLL